MTKYRWKQPGSTVKQNERTIIVSNTVTEESVTTLSSKENHLIQLKKQADVLTKEIAAIKKALNIT